MDKGAWQATVHGVAKSRTRLSDFTFTYYELTFYIYLGLAKKFVWVFSTAAFGKEQNWKYRNDEGQYQRALVQLFPQHCVFLDTVGT